MANDFVDVDRGLGATGEWGEVICVKFDEHDKYIGASYSSGGLKVFNSFTGKVMHTPFLPQLTVSSSPSGGSIIGGGGTEHTN